MEINYPITETFNLHGFLVDCYDSGVKLYAKEAQDVLNGSVSVAGGIMTVRLENPAHEALVDQKVALYTDGRPGPAEVPASVSPRQIRLSMLAHGLNLADVDTFINGLPEPDRSEARVSWEYSIEISRNDPMVAAVGVAFGLTDAQIDDIFIGAEGL